MYGFIIATTQLDLPFSMTRSFVASEPDSPDREAWDYIDGLDKGAVCRPPSQAVPLPFILHYCQRYLIGKVRPFGRSIVVSFPSALISSFHRQWFFSKYRIKKSVMNCDAELLAEPPVDVAVKYDYQAKPPLADGSDLQNYEPNRVKINDIRIKRHGYMLCHMTWAFNEALAYFKRLSCGADTSLNRTWDIYSEPSDK